MWRICTAAFDTYVIVGTKYQVVPLTAAVIVTTPQKLALIDVAKGVRMFSKLKVQFSFVATSNLVSFHASNCSTHIVHAFRI